MVDITENAGPDWAAMSLNAVLAGLGWRSEPRVEGSRGKRIFDASGVFVGQLSAHETWDLLVERGLVTSQGQETGSTGHGVQAPTDETGGAPHRSSSSEATSSPSPDVAAIPVWQMSRGAYQARAGVKQPWIGEISGVQLARMGKRARAQYDAKRAAEWGASHECAMSYARECFEAYVADQSILEHELIAPEARTAILSAKLRWEESERAERERVATLKNRIVDGTELKAGDRVFCIFGREYLRVTKVFKVSIRGTSERDGRERKVPAKACQWLSFDDLKASVAS